VQAVGRFLCYSFVDETATPGSYRSGKEVTALDSRHLLLPAGRFLLTLYYV
jgi:hypothetical protein